MVLVTGTKIAPKRCPELTSTVQVGVLPLQAPVYRSNLKLSLFGVAVKVMRPAGNALTQSLLRELPRMLGTLPQLILWSDDPMCPIPETLTRVRLPLLVLVNSAPICMLPNTFRLQVLVLPQLAATPVQPENWNFAAGIAVRFMVDPFGSVALHPPGHAMLPGLLLTWPEPLTATETVTLFESKVKFALTVVAEFIVILQFPVPGQLMLLPLQPENW